jgi:hypothetical protein
VLTEHLPADEQLFYQQWYEDSASQWSIVNGQKIHHSPLTIHHLTATGIASDFD